MVGAQFISTHNLPMSWGNVLPLGLYSVWRLPGGRSGTGHGEAEHTRSRRFLTWDHGTAEAAFHEGQVSSD